jgi:hypothetical protein
MYRSIITIIVSHNSQVIIIIKKTIKEGQRVNPELLPPQR